MHSSTDVCAVHLCWHLLHPMHPIGCNRCMNPLLWKLRMIILALTLRQPQTFKCILNFPNMNAGNDMDIKLHFMNTKHQSYKASSSEWHAFTSVWACVSVCAQRLEKKTRENIWRSERALKLHTQFTLLPLATINNHYASHESHLWIPTSSHSNIPLLISSSFPPIP